MKNKKIIKFIGILVVIVFLFSYFLGYSGYYEYNLNSRKGLTEDQMKKFEEDIKNGKEIDLNSYLTKSYVDYSNSLTRTTSEANLRLNDYLRRFLTGGFSILGKFIR